jgi:hypothetical protein
LEQLWDWEPETPPSPDAKRMETPWAPRDAYALQSLVARARDMVLSSWPYEVVMTYDTGVSAETKLTVSRKPSRSPSWKFSPTERKLTGTPVARPTVYWTSRLASIPAWLEPCGLEPPSRV